MEVISIERSTYEELLTSFINFVSQMKAMAGRGTDKRLGEWLDNQDVCQILNISPFGVTNKKPNSFTNPPNFALPSFLYFLVLPRLAFYLRAFCVNLPKSLRFYKLFS